jgi:hypothetical protein
MANYVGQQKDDLLLADIDPLLRWLVAVVAAGAVVEAVGSRWLQGDGTASSSPPAPAGEGVQAGGPPCLGERGVWRGGGEGARPDRSGALLEASADS